MEILIRLSNMLNNRYMSISFVVNEYSKIVWKKSLFRKVLFDIGFYWPWHYVTTFLGKIRIPRIKFIQKSSGEIFSDVAYLSFVSHLSHMSKNFYYYKHIWNLSILYLHRTKFEPLYRHLVLPIIRKSS